MTQTYQVKLDAFEGPLDLLLHLIKQYEIDIYDIPVAEITSQYMDYVHTMQQLELNIASEYLVMASHLLALKSQMLLPKQEVDDEESEYTEDPREELMERLIEYRKYKAAAQQLKNRKEEASETFTRPSVIFENMLADQPVTRGNVSVYDMLEAVGKMLNRRKWNQPMEKTVERAEMSIQERMNDILNRVKQTKDGILFDDLFDQFTRPYIVASFIAMLELMKAGDIYCRQKAHFQPIRIQYGGIINGNR